MTGFRLAAVLTMLGAAAGLPAQDKGGKGNAKAPPKGPPDGPMDRKAERQLIEKETGAVAGPTVGKLAAPGKGAIAEIKVPPGYSFIGQPGAAKFAQMTRNLGGDQWAGILLTPDDDFMVFTWEAIGYVKDADKEKLDPDERMTAMKANEEEANKQRKAIGGEAIF